MGYAGVYSSFLRHAYRAAEQYQVRGADILMRCGEHQLVGGQEDQIISIAAELAAEQRPASRSRSPENDRRRESRSSPAPRARSARRSSTGSATPA